MTRQIAVLLTNNDDAAFAQTFPNDGQKVSHFLRALRPGWGFSVVPVMNGVLPVNLNAYDGYVITGSPASVNDHDLPWVQALLRFIQQLHEARRPAIGLCFGHQAMAKALGGEVARHPGGWGLGTGMTHWHQPQAWMTPAAASTCLLAAHNEQVTRMPADAVCLGGSDFCPIGSMQIGDHMWTTQFHPEMSPQFMQALLDHLDDQLDVSTLSRARESLTQRPLDSEHFAQWMVQFLESRFESTP